MALSDRIAAERLPTYTIRDGSLYSELLEHATKRFNSTGVQQVIQDHEGNIADIIGCPHTHVTKHYGRPLVCDRCTRFQDVDGEWKVKPSAKV